MWKDKTYRARVLREELVRTIKLFVESKPYTIGVKTDIKSRRNTYFLAGLNPLPLDIVLIVGDILHNLRSSLDHLAYKLFRESNRQSVNEKAVYFPMFKSYKKYEIAKTSSLKWIDTSLLKVFDEIKPYKGGNDILWKLHNLDIIDKHKLLITVEKVYAGVNIGKYMTQLNNRAFPDFKIPEQSLYLGPVGNMTQLEIGDEWFTDMPGESLKSIEFKIDIILNESGLTDGEKLFDLLEKFIAEVSNVGNKLDAKDE